MRKLIFLTFLFFNFLYASNINIAVAANVSYAIKDLIKEFNKQNPNIKINVTIGSSGKLTAQIQNGAPYDLFMSANMLYPNSIYNSKLALEKPIIYAKGSLVLFSAKKIDLSKGLDILNNKDIKKIAVANTKTAPYGVATKEALEKSNLYKNLKKKFVYGESISQTLSYIMTVTNIGFVAKSSLKGERFSHYEEGVYYIDVPKNLYNPIEQGMVLLKNAKEETKLFYEFMKSQKAKTILKTYGYEV